MAADAKQQPLEQQQDALERELDRGFPRSWRPEPGETLKGTFLRLEQGNTQFGPAPIAIVATDDGEQVSVWLFYESLKTNLMRLAPQPGERVAIRYDGERDVKNPQPGRRATFHSYRVAVDRPAEATRPVDWSKIGVPATVTLEPGEQPRPAELPSDPDEDIPF